MAIVYCSENQAVSRVMLVLHWPNVPVSVCKRLDGKYETKGDFVQMKVQSVVYIYNTEE